MLNIIGNMNVFKLTQQNLFRDALQQFRRNMLVAVFELH